MTSSEITLSCVMEEFEISVANMVSYSSQLPRSNKLCPSCGETEAVFFQSQQRSAETGMVRSLLFSFALLITI